MSSTDARPEVYRPCIPYKRPGLWMDLTQGVLVLGALVFAFATIEPVRREAIDVVDTRRAAMRTYSSLAGRVERVNELDASDRGRAMEEARDSLRKLQVLWDRAEISSKLRPAIETRATGPALVLVDVGQHVAGSGR